MGVEFLPICDVLFNVVSLASYFCDLVFDVIATYTFYKAGHLVWFWLSLVSIASSLVVCQVLSGRWMLSEERHKNITKKKIWILSFIHSIGGGMVWRYSLLFAPIQLEHVKREMRNLCVLRMIHGFAESMPLLIIQTYIACMNPGSMEEINIISMALSLFNVCWALASFTKNIRSHNVHRLVLTWIGVIFQFMWRLGTITSRVLVLVLYSTVFTYWVFLVVVLHWITMMLWVLSRYATHKSERLTPANKVFLSFFVSYIHIFCYLNLEEQNTKLKIVTFYTIMLVENILLIALWTLGLQAEQGGWEGSNRNRVYIAVFSSFFLGLFFMVIYYKYFHVRKLSATLSYSPNEEDASKTRKVKTPSQSSSDPAVTVFNCALNPAIRKKKKMPSRSVPPPPPAAAATPFWKSPLPNEERTAGDGLSYSRTTSVDDIRMKLQEKRDKQMQELRRIEIDIAAGRMERPDQPSQTNQPIPVSKRQPLVLMNQGEEWRDQSAFLRHDSFNENGYPNHQGSYLGLRQPYPESENLSDYPRSFGQEEADSQSYQQGDHRRAAHQRFNPDGQQAEFQQNLRSQPRFDPTQQTFSPQGHANRYGNPQDYQTVQGSPKSHEDFRRPAMPPNVHEEFSRPIHPQVHEDFISRPRHPQDDERLREPYEHQNSRPEAYDRSSRHQDQFARRQPPFQGNFSQPYDPRLERGTAKFYGYKDSSGDQGDVDSGDEVMSRPDSGLQPALPPRLPLPLPRNRVVIGGYDHETPL